MQEIETFTPPRPPLRRRWSASISPVTAEMNWWQGSTVRLLLLPRAAGWV